MDLLTFDQLINTEILVKAKLMDDERIHRWKGAWFSSVKIEYEGI